MAQFLLILMIRKNILHIGAEILLYGWKNARIRKKDGLRN